MLTLAVVGQYFLIVVWVLVKQHCLIFLFFICLIQRIQSCVRRTAGDVSEHLKDLKERKDEHQ